MSDVALAALVLAAGGSRRLGQPKQLVRWRGRSLVRRAVDAVLALGASPAVCVLGSSAEACLAELAGLPVSTVIHPGWQEGIGSSLRAGIAALDALEPTWRGVLILPCDLPRVDVSGLRRLAEAARSRPELALVASSFAGTVGAPAIFPERFAAELRALSGDRGARALLERHAGELVTVEMPEAAADVDDAGDLRELLGRTPR